MPIDIPYVSTGPAYVSTGGAYTGGINYNSKPTTIRRDLKNDSRYTILLSIPEKPLSESIESKDCEPIKPIIISQEFY